jgi:hypothetical protein
VVEGEVNMQDVLESKPGGVIRMRSEGAVLPIPFNDVGQNCIVTLNYLDTIATARAGAAVDLMQGEMQVAASSTTAAINEFGHKEKMSAFYARNIIETLVKGSFQLIHKALRCYWDGPIDVQINGKWVQSNPRQWRPRHTVRVIAGLSGAERREKFQSLGQQLGYQVQAMQMGQEGTLVNGDGLFQTLSDWTAVADHDDVLAYWIDPASEEAQAAAKQKQEAAQKQAESQEKLARSITEGEQNLERWKATVEDEYKRWSDTLSAQVEEMKVTGQGLAALEVEGLKASASLQEQTMESRSEVNEGHGT